MSDEVFFEKIMEVDEAFIDLVMVMIPSELSREQWRVRLEAGCRVDFVIHTPEQEKAMREYYGADFEGLFGDEGSTEE